MNEVLTIQSVVLFLAFGGGAIGLWIRINNLVDAARKDAREATENRRNEILILQKDLTDFKIAAASNYASVDHMKEVEVRLTSAIDRLTNRIENLPRQFAEQVAQILTAERERRS